MLVCDINPFIRFAESISYKSNAAMVNVFDSRIFSVVSGNANIIIDGRQFALCEGSLFYCAGGNCYSFAATENCVINVLNFDLSQNRKNISKPLSPHKLTDGKKIYKNETVIDDGDDLNTYIFIKEDYELQSKIKQIINEFLQKRPLFMEKCSAMLKDVLIDIYRSRLSVKSQALKALDKVTSFICLNLNKKITNTELAYIAGYHEYHLNRLFLKHMGKTVHQYIIDKRIAEAKHLLATTDMTVFEIAESTGFNSSTHLCGCFKAAVGCSPSQYRKSKRPTTI